MKIQEIAALAGVSASTVSRVFNHSPRISKEVRQRVLAIAKEHSYHPRLPAKNRNIVILTPDEPSYPAHYCVEILVMSVSRELSEHNFHIEILPWNNRKRLSSIQFYGAVAIGINAENFLDWGKLYAQPLVVLDREMPHSVVGVWQVSSDEMQAMELAVEHFRDRHLHKIACLIYGTPGLGNADLRFQAALNALKKYDYPHDENLLSFASEESCVEVVGKLLIQDVDALLCPGGSGGLLTAYALNLFGKRIPDDISLISTELSSFSSHSIPPQTALKPDYMGIAAKVVEIFHAVLEGNPFPTKTVLPYCLIKRESVLQKQMEIR